MLRNINNGDDVDNTSANSAGAELFNDDTFCEIGWQEPVETPIVDVETS